MGFVKERKSEIAGKIKEENKIIEVVHKVHVPFTSVSWFISRLCPLNNFKQNKANEADFLIFSLVVNFFGISLQAGEIKSSRTRQTKATKLGTSSGKSLPE
jgi:hypothetical protein